MPQMLNRRMNRCMEDASPVPGRLFRGAIMALAMSVSGCSTAQIDAIPQEIGGLPANAPARPAQAPDFPAVHEMPPQRASALLDAEQQKRLEADLIAIRNRQPNQQTNIAREKARAEKQAKSGETGKKAGKGGGKNKKKKKPGQAGGPAAGQAAVPAGGTAPPGAGTPPWPLPPQTTGATPRP